MPDTIRMAVTIRRQLYERVERLARQLGVPRSALIERLLEQALATLPPAPTWTDAVARPEAGAAGGGPVEAAASAAVGAAAPDRPTQPGSPAWAAKRVAQGQVYWVPLAEAEANAQDPGYTHPHVVVQPDVLNRSRLPSVVVCALTSNLKRAKSPGNVLLDPGEANLPRQSVVVVSQVATVDKSQLGEYIGSLSPERVRQILSGMEFLQGWTEDRPSLL